MSKNKVVYILMAMLLLVSVFAPVYGGDTDRLGTASGYQLLVPVGPRDLAMGGANLAYTNGVEAVTGYLNLPTKTDIENLTVALENLSRKMDVLTEKQSA